MPNTLARTVAVVVAAALHAPTLLAPTLHAQTAAADSAAAVQALVDYRAACRRDAGALWGRSLCGPVILAQPGTLFAVATDSPPGGTFTRAGGIWIGRIPGGIPLANTSFTWVGRPWAIARLPLDGDRFARAALIIHESFHRIQPALGLGGPDAMNVHLDEHDGRLWLRLELRALAAALRARGAPARAAARDALLFRAYRHHLYPAADEAERALELQEGLAEYTGDRLALGVTGTPVDVVADALHAFEDRPTYVRALGYGTGPGLGLLLDRWAKDWRRHVKERSLAPQLAHALGFTPPADLAAAAERRARAYGYEELAAAEDARAAERARRLAEYRARLVDGPVLVLRQDQLNRAFNPNTLVPFGADGTVYPTGTFGAAWGKLEVDSGGALVAADFKVVRLPAPTDTTSRPIAGSGWTLDLAPGWTLAPGARAGDVEVRHTTP